jgi:hypothetical protein
MKLSPEDVGPRWVATAEALLLQRSTAGSQQLLYDPGASAGLLSASNLDFSLNAGPRLTLRRDGPAGMGLELIYFGIDGWQSSADFPNSAFTYGVGNLAIDKTMTVPVSDARFQDTSRIYSGEINLRYAWNDWLTPLAGLRWVEFEDRYAVNGTDYQFSAPFTDVVRGHNHLYGAQIGLDACWWDGSRRFQVDFWGKAGLYGAAAAQDNDYQDTVRSFSASAVASSLSFLGEVGLTGCYRFTDHLAVRGGYQVMWLTGLALAPAQIPATDFGAGQAGVDTSGSLFCQGANAGLELVW